MPTNLKVQGAEERLTVEVVYQTKALYGEVTGRREVIIQAE